MLTFTPWGFGSTMVLLLATVKTMKEKDRSVPPFSLSACPWTRADTRRSNEKHDSHAGAVGQP